MGIHIEARKLSWCSRFAERFILTYQARVSARVGARCRFHPSCSEYGLEAYRRHGFLRATAKTVWRVMRCNPLKKPGAYDPV